MIKKIVPVMAAGVMLVALGSTPALAAKAPASTPFCSISNCTKTGTHQHNGKSYTAHSKNDGHKNHTQCNVNGCNKTGIHTAHNGSHKNNKHNTTGGHH